MEERVGEHVAGIVDAGPSSDAWFNSLSRPIALDRLADIERKVRPLPYKIFRPNGQRRVNVLVPTLDEVIRGDLRPVKNP